jgi:AraC-like DNA-binding protein
VAVNRILNFDDPIEYQSAIRAGDVRIIVADKGKFHAELVQIDFSRLWMQYARESLPRVAHSAIRPNRAPIMFNADTTDAPVQYCGKEVGPNEIFFHGAAASTHIRTWKASRWAAMSLTPEDLSAAGAALIGRDVGSGHANQLLRPHPSHLRRLLRLHAAARRLAEMAPDALAHAEVSAALEHELIHAMVTCLSDEVPAESGPGWRHHTAIINRFEDMLAANCDRPIYLAEICAAVGASARTLRNCCEEQLGMGPMRYLWLRRMHLARRALLKADPAKTTVTEIATDHGFWELGRFSVSYQALFGEAPSITLRRARGNVLPTQIRPSSLPDSAFA